MIRCDFCGEACVPTETTSGYGVTRLGEHACFTCCAWLDVRILMTGSDPGLYDVGPTDDGRPGEIQNWCGTLRMIVRSRRRSPTGREETIQFYGPCGSIWRGTLYHTIAAGNLLRNVRPLKGSRTYAV